MHPDADTEYDAFVNADRSTAYDVGNHFGVLESIVNGGLPEHLRPVYMEEGCDLYVFYGNVLQIFRSHARAGAGVNSPIGFG